MQWLKNLFVSTKSPSMKQLRRTLLTSALSLLLCAGCLVGTTFAWFQHSVNSAYTLEIGSFSATGYMSNELTRSGAQLTNSDCVLPVGAYTLTVRANGNSFGYCVVSLTAQESGTAREVYCTGQMRSGETQQFTIHLNEQTALSIRSVWGELTGPAPILEKDRVLIYGRPPVVAVQKTEADTSTEGASAEETPKEETPVEEPPIEEPPIEETPIEETPIEETPIEETPIEETPIEETPVEETPIEETPVEETPVEEPPTETPIEGTPTGSAPTEDMSE